MVGDQPIFLNFLGTETHETRRPLCRLRRMNGLMKPSFAELPWKVLCVGIPPVIVTSMKNSLQSFGERIAEQQLFYLEEGG